jgi:hypothetical protein
MKRVVEELCMDLDYQPGVTHWHPLTLESLLNNGDGEYDLTVRVRTLGKRKKRYSVKAGRKR